MSTIITLIRERRRGTVSCMLALALCLAMGFNLASADTANDARIKEQLQSRLSGLVSIHPERMEVTVTDGVVRITGSVASVGEKLAVGRIAGSVAGATSVTNDLSVRALDRPDAAVRQEVSGLLKNRPKFRDADIHVAVSGSQVTLTGKVKHASDKAEAEDIAGTAMGVTRVVNSLEVDNKVTIPDETIKSNIGSALKNPVTFGVVKDLEIVVEDGMVTLRGSVVRESDRLQAERLALGVDGVTSVENLITVTGS